MEGDGRGIGTADILKGIHDSMAGRFVKLLRSSKCTGTVAITGGLSADIGLIAAMEEAANNAKLGLTLVADPNAVYAGAIGAALWGAFRWQKLQQKRPAQAAAMAQATA